MKKYFAILLVISVSILAQNIEPPLIKSNYSKLTTNKEIINYLNDVYKSNKRIFQFDTIGFSHNGLPIVMLKISNFTKMQKVKVLLFAQQHGNEPSGKEGLMLLVNDLVNKKNIKLLNNLDLYIIPQINPDGGEIDVRQNAIKIDLNRDHLTLESKEVKILHDIYDKIKPDVTLDIHEYYPFSKSWMNYGIIKNYDVQIGCLTNPNCDKDIMKFQKEKYVPYMFSKFEIQNYTINEYIVGGPPNSERLRYSTYDINDGRQSFGIQGSLSFIQEGKNGKDSIDNIKRRAETQMYGALCLLNFCSENKSKIIKLVQRARKEIKENSQNEISLRMEHIWDGKERELKLLSLKTEKDTIIRISNLHSADSIVRKVNKPLGYLISKKDTLLKELMSKHNFYYESNFKNDEKYKFEQYKIIRIDTTIEEELECINPKVQKQDVELRNIDNYYFIPLNQIKNIFIVSALEPESLLGIVQYPKFYYLLRNEYYPIIRVIRID